MKDSKEFEVLFNFLNDDERIRKMIWANDDMDLPALAGVRKEIEKLHGREVNFLDKRTKQLTGAIIAFLLKGKGYRAADSARVNSKFFTTAKRYIKDIK